jgi:predicted component of type VI protein secretion system
MKPKWKGLAFLKDICRTDFYIKNRKIHLVAMSLKELVNNLKDISEIRKSVAVQKQIQAYLTVRH